MNKKEINIIYGNSPCEMAYEILQKIDLEPLDLLKNNKKNLKAVTSKILKKKEIQIGIKPNLVLDSPSEEGATTSPELVEGVIKYLKDRGYHNLVIMESSWVGCNTSKAFDACGYRELAQQYNVELRDLKKDQAVEIEVENLKLNVCKSVFEIDYFINIPVLKAHCQTLFTCALKNLKGCIPDSEKRRFHRLGLHQPIAYLAKALKTDLTIVDAVIGDLTFEEGGNPVRMDRIIAGWDPVLVDSYGTSLIGYSSDDINYLQIAENVGVGSTDISTAEINEYNTGDKGSCNFRTSSKIKKLTQRVNPREACSACYGSLIHALQRLDDKGKYERIGDIYIGQGYRGQTGKEGIGIGNCTSNFKKCIKGCPPSARKIVEFIYSQC